jgi:ABC-type branched-subunit amino acid transport system permease subunit
LLALPIVGDNYMVKVGIEVMVLALAAFSLHFLIGVGGLVSFGHAAYFGIGAYAAGLLVTGPAIADGAGAAAEPRSIAGGSCGGCSASSSCGCRASISRC